MYPVALRSDVVNYLTQASLGEVSSLKSSSRSADADYFDLIDSALEDVMERFREMDPGAVGDQGRDAVEGELSETIYLGLKDLPAAVLCDRDFWRFCAVRMYDFVVWRQTPSAKVSTLFPYFGVAGSGIGRDCVPHRMFDRGMIASIGGLSAGDNDPFGLAKFGAADVWKSHILRVYNGYAPLLVHEMLLDVGSGVLPTDVVRPVVKQLRRIRANVLFEILTQEQSRVLLDEAKGRIEQ